MRGVVKESVGRALPGNCHPTGSGLACKNDVPDTPTTTMQGCLENEEMLQIQPLLHTEEINSTSVWPIIHMIRAVRSTFLPIVSFFDWRPTRMLW